MKWFRLYTDVLDDPKAQQLPGDIFKAWINLLCLANREERGGLLPDFDAITFALRVSPSKARRIIDKLLSVRLLDDDLMTGLSVHNWAERQPKSDDAAGRMRAARSANTERTPSEHSPNKFAPEEKRGEEIRKEHTQRRSDEAAPAAGGGGVVSDKPQTKNADTIVMADLRGPPYDIIAACDTYIGRCIWDWYPQLAEMKAKYTAEELEHGFTECSKRRGKTPSYVISVIEGSRSDATAGRAAENGQRDPGSLANVPTLAEYEAIIAARRSAGAQA